MVSLSLLYLFFLLGERTVAPRGPAASNLSFFFLTTPDHCDSAFVGLI
jgi:hypothetical protein